MSYSKKYINYLKSKKWKARRYAALERAKFKCQFDECFERESLAVHHKTYDRLGNEDPGNLIVLCSGHHWYIHKKNKKSPILKTLRKHHIYHKATLCKTGIKFLRRLPKKTTSKRYKRNQNRKRNDCS